VPESRLNVSPYLHLEPHEVGSSAFHRVRGGLVLLDRQVTALINRMPRSSPFAPADVASPEVPPDTCDRVCRSLAEFGFLVAADVNETEEIERWLSDRCSPPSDGSRIGVLQLIVSNRCNLRCTYCFLQDAEYLQRHADPGHGENVVMTPESAVAYSKEAIRFAASAGQRTLSIQFFGGEPLTNWAAVEAVLRTFGTSCDEVAIRYEIVTNGTLITEPIARALKEFRVDVIVSQDTPGRGHRPMRNGQSSSAAAAQGLRLLRRWSNKMALNATLCDETYEEFDTQMVAYAFDHGVYSIGILLALDTGFYSRHPTKEIVDKVWRICEAARRVGIGVTGYWDLPFRLLQGRDILWRRPYKTCSATGCQLSIEPSGAVFPCKASPRRLGSVTALDRVVHSPAYRTYLKREMRNADACRGCPIEFFCSGLCPGQLDLEKGRVDTIVPDACRVYRELVRRRIRSLDESAVHVLRATPS